MVIFKYVSVVYFRHESEFICLWIRSIKDPDWLFLDTSKQTVAACLNLLEQSDLIKYDVQKQP